MLILEYVMLALNVLQHQSVQHSTLLLKQLERASDFNLALTHLDACLWLCFNSRLADFIDVCF